MVFYLRACARASKHIFSQTQFEKVCVWNMHFTLTAILDDNVGLKYTQFEDEDAVKESCVE